MGWLPRALSGFLSEQHSTSKVVQRPFNATDYVIIDLRSESTVDLRIFAPDSIEPPRAVATATWLSVGRRRALALCTGCNHISLPAAS